MARIDERAAKAEEQKAREYTAQASELIEIASSLRESAKFHLREADDLRGIVRRRRRQRFPKPAGGHHSEGAEDSGGFRRYPSGNRAREGELRALARPPALKSSTTAASYVDADTPAG